MAPLPGSWLTGLVAGFLVGGIIYWHSFRCAAASIRADTGRLLDEAPEYAGADLDADPHLDPTWLGGVTSELEAADFQRVGDLRLMAPQDTRCRVLARHDGAIAMVLATRPAGIPGRLMGDTRIVQVFAHSANGQAYGAGQWASPLSEPPWIHSRHVQGPTTAAALIDAFDALIAEVHDGSPLRVVRSLSEFEELDRSTHVRTAAWRRVQGGLTREDFRSMGAGVDAGVMESMEKELFDRG